MSINFTETEIPAVTVKRATEPNPFSDVFPTKEGRALTVTLPGTVNDTEKDKSGNTVATAHASAIRKLTAQARKAANDVDKTARVHAEVTGSGKQAKTVLTIWTVNRVRRPRQGTES